MGRCGPFWNLSYSEVLYFGAMKYAAGLLIAAVTLAIVTICAGLQWAFVFAAALLLCFYQRHLFALALVGGLLFGEYGLMFASRFLPHTYDKTLLALDARLGYHPEAAIAGLNGLHLVWALQIWYELRKKPLAVRLVTDLGLLFTVVGTLGFGEHYLVDLIAAVPFWVLMEWLFAPSPQPSQAEHKQCNDAQYQHA